ncbi:hypothetical protein Tsubulata_043964, partial [Turnera subulata]
MKYQKWREGRKGSMMHDDSVTDGKNPSLARESKTVTIVGGAEVLLDIRSINYRGWVKM